jgi:hypothetical protein
MWGAIPYGFSQISSQWFCTRSSGGIERTKQLPIDPENGFVVGKNFLNQLHVLVATNPNALSFNQILCSFSANHSVPETHPVGPDSLNQQLSHRFPSSPAALPSSSMRMSSDSYI